MNIRTWAALALASASPALIFACSSSGGTTPDLTTTTIPTSSSTGTGGSPPVDSGVDASVDAGIADAAMLPDVDAAATCAAAMQEGREVEEITQDYPLADASGGSITPGTYLLTQLDTYEVIDAGGDPEGLNSVATGYTAAKTLVLGADGTFWLVEATGTEDAGLGASMTSGGVYTVSGTNLVLASSCPPAAAGTTVMYPYIAQGGSLSLYDGVHDLVFIRDVMP
jgi:hypothetical protein